MTERTKDLYLDRHDKMKKLNRSVTLQDPYYQTKDWNPIAVVGLISIGFIAGTVSLSLIKSCDREPQPAAVKNSCTTDCHSRKKSMIDYFRRAGNKHPEQMAVAVLATQSPRLLAAMATKGELNTPYTVRKGGYKRRHAGAWQMNQRLHGTVSHNPVDQAKQAEKYLEELLDQKPLRKALSQYGGDSTDKYANRVLAELVNVP